MRFSGLQVYFLGHGPLLAQVHCRDGVAVDLVIDVHWFISQWLRLLLQDRSGLKNVRVQTTCLRHNLLLHVRVGFCLDIPALLQHACNLLALCCWPFGPGGLEHLGVKVHEVGFQHFFGNVVCWRG